MRLVLGCVEELLPRVRIGGLRTFAERSIKVCLVPERRHQLEIKWGYRDQQCAANFFLAFILRSPQADV